MPREKKLHIPGSQVEVMIEDHKVYRNGICGIVLEDSSRNFGKETCKNCIRLHQKDKKAAGFGSRFSEEAIGAALGSSMIILVAFLNM